MSVASGQGGPREKSRTPKPKAANPDALSSATQLPTAQPLTAAASVARDAAATPTVDDSSKGLSMYDNCFLMYEKTYVYDMEEDDL